jgi:hypothetical protein
LRYAQYEIYDPIIFNQSSLDVYQNSSINKTVLSELNAEIIQFFLSFKTQWYNIFDSNNSI